ncbi:LexA family protein [Woodsholea maritima]|uniref:LexA family protein n=1 Tax=Woodsholea maritima TaxID=240237 RepID=UPI00039FAAC3|nr:translesion error-prone DNA polymerase V autoproteolytic subunit [Woodsholea maritima]
MSMHPPAYSPPNARNDRDGVRTAPPGYVNTMAGGFPSPADDYLERDLDLHRYAVQHPACTFFARAIGHAMVGAGIHDGDILVIDRSLTPVSGQIVVVDCHGELMIRRLKLHGRQRFLCAEHPDFTDLDISQYEDITIWGVAVHVLHALLQPRP